MPIPAWAADGNVRCLLISTLGNYFISDVFEVVDDIRRKSPCVNDIQKRILVAILLRFVQFQSQSISIRIALEVWGEQLATCGNQLGYHRDGSPRSSVYPKIQSW